MKRKKTISKVRDRKKQNRTIIKPQSHKGKKDHKFEAENADPETVKSGMDLEKFSVKRKSIIWGGLMILGIVALFYGFYDKVIIFRGFGTEFSMTSIGLAIIMIAAIGLIMTYPKVKIQNK